MTGAPPPKGPKRSGPVLDSCPVDGTETLLPVVGGTDEFESFYEGERHRLFGALCLITGDRYEAEELAQDAFIAVWERWDRVRAMDSPTGYLYRTAMNAFRKRRRRAALALRRVVG